MTEQFTSGSYRNVEVPTPKNYHNRNDNTTVTCDNLFTQALSDDNELSTNAKNRNIIHLGDCFSFVCLMPCIEALNFHCSVDFRNNRSWGGIVWCKLHKKQHVSAFFGKSVLKCHLT